MPNRWTILAVLFFARFAMAFQFESVGALAPLMGGAYGFSLAEIGLLIGLYLGPGLIVAIPGGAIAGWLGDRRIITLSMLLMLAGGAMIAQADGFWLFSAGRVLSGIGGVVINIVMTKMVVDWFVGREISTAMALFINSWPIGIAVALFTLPLAAALGGLWLAWVIVLVVTLLGLLLFLAAYQPAPGAAAAAQGVRATRLPLVLVLLSSLVWALFNVGLAMIYSFAPAFLLDRGFSLATAGSLTGAFMVALAVSIPVGGILSDRLGRPGLVVAASVSGFCALVLLTLGLPVSAAPYLLVVALFVYGFSAGPVVSLPSRFLAPQERAFGMGVYYSFYYGVMMIGPYVGGGLSDRAGDPAAALLFGVSASIAGLMGLALFHRIERAPAAA